MGGDQACVQCKARRIARPDETAQVKPCGQPGKLIEPRLPVGPVRCEEQVRSIVIVLQAGQLRRAADGHDAGRFAFFDQEQFGQRKDPGGRFPAAGR